MFKSPRRPVGAFLLFPPTRRAKPRSGFDSSLEPFGCWRASLLSRDAQKTLPAREAIDTAPIDKNVLVLVTDGASEYRIPYPCWLTKALGWMNSSQGDRAESRPNGRPAKVPR
jgi:hypothetical protein